MCYLSVFTITFWWHKSRCREPPPAGKGSRKMPWTLAGQGGSLILYFSSREKHPSLSLLHSQHWFGLSDTGARLASLWRAQQLSIEFLLAGGDTVEPTQNCPGTWQTIHCHLPSMLKFFQFFFGHSNRGAMLPYKHFKFVSWMFLFGLLKFFTWLVNKSWHFHPLSNSPFVTKYVDTG